MTFPLCWLFAFIGWWVICNRKYLLGFSFQIAAWHPLVTDCFSFLFWKRKSALLNIQKNRKGIPLDSYRPIRISWYVVAMVEQLSLINPTTTSQTRKEICTRLILVSFYQKQYNSLKTFLIHSCRPCWVNSDIWPDLFLYSRYRIRSLFLNAHPHIVVRRSCFYFNFFLFTRRFPPPEY